MSKEREQGTSVSTVTVNDDSGAAINPSINQLISLPLPSPSVLEPITLRRLLKVVWAVSPSGFLSRTVPLSSMPLKMRVEKVTPVKGNLDGTICRASWRMRHNVEPKLCRLNAPTTSLRQTHAA